MGVGVTWRLMFLTTCAFLFRLRHMPLRPFMRLLRLKTPHNKRTVLFLLAQLLLPRRGFEREPCHHAHFLFEELPARYRSQKKGVWHRAACGTMECGSRREAEAEQLGLL